MTRKGPADFGDEIGPAARAAAGAIRRMIVTLTSRALWQIAGHRLLDNTTETRDAEVFSGIGFYSRPPTSGSPEAIVLFPGSLGGGPAAGPVIVGLRDEKTRQAIAGSIAVDETMMFNGASVVHIKATGIVAIGDSAAIDAAVKGTTYRAAEDVMLTAIAALATALAVSSPPLVPASAAATATAATAAATAIATFQSASATYLATKVKVS